MQKNIMALFVPYLALTTSTIQAKPHSYSANIDFDLNHGGYYLPVSVEGHRTPLKLLIDTGSSNLNLIGNQAFCPRCKPVSRKLQRYSPPASVKDMDKHFVMRYGLGGGKVQQYQGQVSLFNQALSIGEFDFGVYKTGDSVSNILGFAYKSSAAPINSPLTPLFHKLNMKYNFNHQFTLQLCGEQGKSKLYLGPTPKIFNYLPQYTVPITKKSLFFVKHFGISLPGGRKIIDVPEGDNTIIDSGTTAKIIYPDIQIAILLKFLKKYTTEKNLLLPNSFWNGQTCIPKSMIEPEAFPVLYLNFQDIHGKPFRLGLPPERYITQHACGKDYYKLAFIGMNVNRRDKKLPPDKKFLPAFAVIGTPFLEQYATTFKKDLPSIITFYDSREILCRKKDY